MPKMQDVGELLMTKLYSIVAGGDGAVPAPPGSYVSWCRPGLPFFPADFDFAHKGMVGATAEETRELNRQAYEFAALVDFIPNADQLFDDQKQENVYRTSGDRLSYYYGEILKGTKIAKTAITPAEEAEIDLIRKSLVVDGSIPPEDMPRVQIYNAYKKKAIDARRAYNTKRIAANTATGAEGAAAVADFAANGPSYVIEVTNAESEWGSVGLKEKVEGDRARINQLTARNMRLWKDRLTNQLKNGLVAAVGGAGEFYYTKPVPGKFATSEGWTEFTFSHSEKAADTSRRYQKFDGGAKLNFGLWSFGGGGGRESSSFKSSDEVSSFSVKFDLTQVIITRPWFFPEFFKNQGWNLIPGQGWEFDSMPSNGAEPPKGMFIGYPTAALFARNIEITSAELANAYSADSTSVNANASAGWGPFRVRGGYRSDSSNTKFRSRVEGETLKVQGMQIIGFINQLLPKAPNPLPDLKPTDFE